MTGRLRSEHNINPEHHPTLLDNYPNPIMGLGVEPIGEIESSVAVGTNVLS